MRVFSAVAIALLFTSCLKISEDKKPAGEQASAPAATAGSGPKTKVAVRGSEAMRRLTSSLAKAYGKLDADVQGGGTSAGFAALANNSAQIAQASRPASPEERAAGGGTLVETPLAFDAVTIYVHPSNPVSELSIQQLAAIVTGKTTNWRDVGGPNAPITVYGEADASGFTGYLGIPDAPPAPQRDYADARGVVGAVAADPNGIGYAALIPTTGARFIWVRRADGVSVAPSGKSVRDRSYPLSGRLYLYTRADAPEAVKQFVAWCRGPEGKKALEDAGYVQP